MKFIQVHLRTTVVVYGIWGYYLTFLALVLLRLWSFSPIDRHVYISDASTFCLGTPTLPDQLHNVVLVGGPGTGKTHLATALGVQAVQHQHRRVRYFSTIELVNALELEKAAGKQGQLASRMMYADLVILDELGYLPFSQAGGALGQNSMQLVGQI